MICWKPVSSTKILHSNIVDMLNWCSYVAFNGFLSLGYLRKEQPHDMSFEGNQIKKQTL
jgi:hypothetical protein